MEKDLGQLIKDYMKEQKLMQLATTGKDGLWVCSVWFGYDEDYNIYFFSAVNRQHSAEIAEDPNVAGAMALPQSTSDKPRGLQFRGKAEKLSKEGEIAKARSVYQDRIFNTEAIDKLMAHPERPHAFYKIKPSKFVLFDVVNFPDNSRQEFFVK